MSLNPSTPSSPTPVSAQRVRWLVTGGSGRVGRMVVRHWELAPPAAELLIQTRSGTSGLIWDPMQSILPTEAGQIDCLIAMAGITPATGQPLDVNAALAVATLESAKQRSIPRVLLTSSSAVYGISADSAPIREGDPLRPLNPYGASKVAMEAACQPFRDAGIEVCCLRIGNVAGADALLLNGPRASEAIPLTVDRFADGRGPIRSYLGPATLARVLACLAAHPHPLPPALNIAAPEPIGMADLAEAAGLPWVWRDAPTSAVQTITLDCSAISRLCHFSATDSSAAEMVRQWQLSRDPI